MDGFEGEMPVEGHTERLMAPAMAARDPDVVTEGTAQVDSVVGDSEKGVIEGGVGGPVNFPQSPILGPILVKVTDTLMEGFMALPGEGKQAELDYGVILIRAKGADLGEGQRAIIGSVNGVAGAVPEPDEVLEVLTAGIREIVQHTDYQNPFDRLVATEETDQELMSFLTTIVAEVNELDGKKFRKLRLWLTARRRELKLVKALNEWARAHSIIKKTGEKPQGEHVDEEAVKGLDKLAKDDFEK